MKVHKSLARYIGLDYGDKAIGVAISSPNGRVATGVTTLRRKDPLAVKLHLADMESTYLREKNTSAIK